MKNSQSLKKGKKWAIDYIAHQQFKTLNNFKQNFHHTKNLDQYKAYFFYYLWQISNTTIEAMHNIFCWRRRR